MSAPPASGRPLKVAVISENSGGGAGNAALRGHLALLAAGCDSTFIVKRDRSGGGIPGLSAAGPEHVKPGRTGPDDMNDWRRWKNLLRAYPQHPPDLELFTDTSSNLALEAIPAVRAADVVHVHWAPGCLDLPSAPAMLAGKPVVWTMHDMNPFTGGCHYSLGCERWRESCGRCPALGSDKDFDHSRAGWMQRRKAYASLRPHMVSPSGWLAGEARASSLLAGLEVSVIPNCVPLDVFQPWDTAEARQTLGIPPEAPVILFGADYDAPRKGAHLLLAALEALPPELAAEVRLAVFGVLAQAPANIPAGHVLNLGRIGDPLLLAHIYALADVLALPSLWDNLPNVAVEALACGTPCAAFAIGGLTDIVEHGRSGFLAAPGDAAGLAQALIWCLERRRSADLRTACRAKALRDYAPATHAARLIELYAHSRA